MIKKELNKLDQILQKNNLNHQRPEKKLTSIDELGNKARKDEKEGFKIGLRRMLARSSNIQVDEESIFLDFKLVRDQEGFSK